MLKYTSNEKSLTQFETSTWQTSSGSPGVSRLPKQTKLYIKGLLIFFKDVSENQNAQNYLSAVHFVNRSLILNFADFFDTWTSASTESKFCPKFYNSALTVSKKNCYKI